MSYQSGVAYQQPQRFESRGSGGSYYYGDDNSNRNQPSRPHHVQGDRGPDHNRTGYNGYDQNDYRPGGPQQYQDRREQPSYGQQQVNRNIQPQENTSHRYPATFQDESRPPPPRQPSWERYDSNQIDRGRGPRSPAPGESQRPSQVNEYRNRYDTQGTTSPQFLLGNAKDTYGNTQDQGFSSREQPYGKDREREDRSYQPDQNNSHNDQRSLGWREERERNGVDSNSGFRRQDARSSGGFQGPNVADDSYTSRERDGYGPPQSKPAPPPPQGYQSYENRTKSQNQLHADYNQYNSQRDSRPPQDANFYRGGNYTQNQRENLDAPGPPQVLAQTSGSTAVFGLVAKVDPSPTRQSPPPKSPTRDYGPSFDHRQPERGPIYGGVQPPASHHALTPILEQPSPPSFPTSRGRPTEPTWESDDARDRPRQYGPPVDISRNRNQNQDRGSITRPPDVKYPSEPGQVPYADSGYRERPPPVVRGNDRFREEYNESSGYGSESTHNTDRSYGDYHGNNRSNYDDRPQLIRKPNEPHQDSRYDREPRREPEMSRSPPRMPEYDPNPKRTSNMGQPSQPQDYGHGPRQPPDGIRSPLQQRDYSMNVYGRENGPRVTDDGGYGQRPEYRPGASQIEAPGNSNRFPLTEYRENQQRHPQPQDRQGPRSPNRVSQNNPPMQSGYFRNYDDRDKINRGTRPGSGRGPPPQIDLNGSGVEESHVKSVRDAKSVFERQTDPSRPPPAPKPLITPKPPSLGNMNSRPVPPRPRNISDSDFNRQGDGYQNRRNAPDPRSPTYVERERCNKRQQDFQQRPPTHSQSMFNLDDRTRYTAPVEEAARQHHAAGPDQPSYDQRYRNSYSGDTESRPMVLAVKYNKDTGSTLYNHSEPQRHPNSRNRDSWQQPDQLADQYAPQGDRPERGPISPTRPRQEEWPSEPMREYNQRSYNNNNNWSERDRGAPPPPSQPPRRSNEDDNFVPDVVARSYEAFSQSQPPGPEKQAKQGYQVRQTEPSPKYNQPFDDRRDRPQEWENRGPVKNPEERWPTPPPSLEEQRPRQPPNQSSVYGQNGPGTRTVDQRTKVDYTDDWRRPGPPPAHTGPPQYQPRPGEIPQDGGGVTDVQYPNAERIKQPPPKIYIPPPPGPAYNNDSDSSEGIDVDAPTPPPFNKQTRAPHLAEPRSNSPYDMNKPVPVTNRHVDPNHRSRPQYGQDGRPARESSGPPLIRPERPFNSAEQTQGPRKMVGQLPEGERVTGGVKSPPPRKPQRNSLNLASPEPSNRELPHAGKDDEFDFKVAENQALCHASSRDRQRLARSGALANRKPPSRQGSTSNLVEVGNDDDDYQIEVTDRDLTKRANPIEVHREESMKIIRQKKAHEKDLTTSESSASSVIERPLLSKSSNKEKPTQKQAAAKSAESAKKVDSKLLFKIPSTEVAKSSTAHPIPGITEPVAMATRRPPTYLGFGSEPEKPKHKPDLLSQFKDARENAYKSAAAKQSKALKSVTALVRMSHGKKQPKSPPKPKPSAAERNAAVLEHLNVEIRPPEEDNHRHHHKHDARGDSYRNSTRSTSTAKAEKYDGDDDTTNGSRHEKDRRGRGRDRHHDDDRGKSRGRSRSRDREISPDSRERGRSRSRERAISPDGRNKSRGREIDDRRHDDRRRYDDDPPISRRSHSPDRHRYNPADSRYTHFPQPYERHHTTREPDWVEQFRRGRERSSQPMRRAWVHDPRRVEVVPGGARRPPHRELDMDAFERDVRRATSYNSDFEQPEPRRQMMPTKLMARGPPPSQKRQQKGDWMNALKEKNRNAERARFGHVSRY